MSLGAVEPAFARAFVAARRHSLLVRALRVALLVGAIGTVVVLIALGLLRTFGSALGRLSVGAMSIDGAKIIMDKPRLTGARQNGGGYVITAAKAMQDVRRPTEVDLEAIEGEIGAADHDTLSVSATSGHYDSARETLELSGVVRFRNSRYNVELRSAHIDFKTGAYSSSEPVSVFVGKGNSILADLAEVRDEGREVRFEGHVRSIFQIADGEPTLVPPSKGAVP